jgi:hypothetical protein
LFALVAATSHPIRHHQRRTRRPGPHRRRPVAAFTHDLVDGHIQNLRFQVNPAELGALQASNKALG